MLIKTLCKNKVEIYQNHKRSIINDIYLDMELEINYRGTLNYDGGLLIIKA